MVGISHIAALGFVLVSTVKSVRVSSKTTLCPAREWSLAVLPNVHQNPATPWRRDEEGEYVFSLPEAKAGWFRAAIHEADCPSFARHPEGKATFNCESNGEWRMTKETCSHSSSDCFSRTVHVTTEDGYAHDFPFQSGDNGAEVSSPCNLGPWTGGEINFLCRDNNWQVNGPLGCTQTHVVEAEIVDCIAQGGYQVTLAGETAEYALPHGHFGERVNQPCSFATRSQGKITFLCQESGAWTAVGQQCSAPRIALTAAEPRCGAKVKNLSISGSRQRFPMEANEVGATVEVACTGDLEGTATFTCSESNGRTRWRLTLHSCKRQ